MPESLQEKISRVTAEKIEIKKYDSRWKKLFEEEKKYLLKCSPKEIIKRIEHFGSTSIPKMPSKPVIDMLVEVTSLNKTKKFIVPILEKHGYDYFWRPTWGDDVPPYYCFFIKRNKKGERTHHIHMIEKDFEHWDRLFFRDYLKEKPIIAKEYAELKIKLSKKYFDDRVAYTKAKTNFIERITKEAKEYYKSSKF